MTFGFVLLAKWSMEIYEDWVRCVRCENTFHILCCGVDQAVLEDGDFALLKDGDSFWCKGCIC